MPKTELPGGWLRDKSKFRCHDCKEIKDRKLPGSNSYQFGLFGGDGRDGVKVCLSCCAARDAKILADTPVGEKVKGVVLYASEEGKSFKISNWPGTLKLTLLETVPHYKSQRKTFTFALHKEAQPGVFLRLGVFTAQLRTSNGNYLSLLRRIR